MSAATEAKRARRGDLLLAAATCVVVGTLLSVAGIVANAIAANPTPAPEPKQATIILPPCPTEDSNNCYWDAQSRGNGQGTSFVVIDGVVYYPNYTNNPTTEEVK